ncbi:Predicted nucleic acid-binding protein, contains PIN domain [Cyclobacterium lianum]|uniref:Predicted nucleic acid-binding protein, contains PIN domain n=1 Tax=Cyclobacterium lianum TaxID=388280 RepID=A0A1M7NTB0_9BACT|nr:PIN domain-containing protein [Cyclobacterium lianum]SHN07256.1 Predicted nucleic acid-binding protein, contains PIN domain [Cyclobacterium lianum]
MNRILFDANVLLDFFLERNSQPEKIEKLFDLVDDKKIEGFVTLSILQICSYYLTRAKGLVVTKGILEMVILKFQLLQGSRKTVLNALKSDQQDIEDAIHYFIALENEMDAIVTLDKEFLRLSSPYLPIYSPINLLAKLS